MEANEAPEKIYLDSYASGFSHGFHTNKLYDNDIEYIRTDAFIEKACAFIRKRLIFDDNAWYIEGKVTIKDKVIEDFKNYIKGE